MSKFNIGDRVRHIYTSEYLGTVQEVEVVTYYHLSNKQDSAVYSEDSLEAAPKLTAEDAWSQVAFVIHAELDRSYIYDPTQDDLRAARHEAYKFLGGAGIKIDEAAKQRVREVVDRVVKII